MLAETFEDVRTKFIAEKVQHNPFVMAYHAEGEGWELYATNSGKTKFWGGGFALIEILRITEIFCRQKFGSHPPWCHALENRRGSL